jgi:hypothetical protein
MLLILIPILAAAFAQTPAVPPATFTGTVRTIDADTLTLARPDEEDLDITLTHKTHYYAAAKKIKRSDIKAGNHVTVEATLDPYLKPQAVNVRVTPAL